MEFPLHLPEDMRVAMDAQMLRAGRAPHYGRHKGTKVVLTEYEAEALGVLAAWAHGQLHGAAVDSLTAVYMRGAQAAADGDHVLHMACVEEAYQRLLTLKPDAAFAPQQHFGVDTAVHVITALAELLRKGAAAMQDAADTTLESVPPAS